MTTATSPTTIDRNADKKKLEEEIVALKSTKDTADRETKVAIEAAEHARTTLGTLQTQITEILALIPNVSRETHEFIAHCTSIMQESGAKVREMVSMAIKIEEEACKGVKALTATKKEAEDIHTKAVAEEATMQRNREDLDIYHNRLKEHFAKHLPDQKIIL